MRMMLNEKRAKKGGGIAIWEDVFPSPGNEGVTPRGHRAHTNRQTVKAAHITLLPLTPSNEYSHRKATTYQQTRSNQCCSKGVSYVILYSWVGNWTVSCSISSRLCFVIFVCFAFIFTNPPTSSFFAIKFDFSLSDNFSESNDARYILAKETTVWEKWVTKTARKK